MVTKSVPAPNVSDRLLDDADRLELKIYRKPAGGVYAEWCLHGRCGQMFDGLIESDDDESLGPSDLSLLVELISRIQE